ncbi:MAG: c-type cytochrome [Betaproteobacteria bacterium]|jgi:cytochrome c peroxidase|nr:MAG: c-type cytochrome [Betaproteobacteria bacterium]
MMKISDVKVLAFAALAVVVLAVSSLVSADDAKNDLLARAQAVFKPLPESAATADRPLTAARVELGRALFFETRVSTDGKQSCAQCHQPMFYGTDALAESVGNQGKRIPRNVPTVLNTALQFAQHYGGNRVDVEEQAVKALPSSLAYGNADLAAAEERLRAISGYRAMFEKAFPGQAAPVTAENWGLAIGAYERTLLTPAPFDDYLKGDTSAIGPDAKRGLEKFMSYGCAGCHGGVVLGGQMFQKFGITQNYWELTGSTEKELLKGRDKGRFHDTKDQADAFMFKVQQLRNVAVTPPYFHDGSVATLPEAVRIMAKLQLGRDLGAEDVSDIVAFLETLTGEVPENFANAPVLPTAPFLN